ncbi:hypothetical protein A0H81_00558 [Grifola frondosa]|uniref:Uncharacterized protein n=1 Tax=Grifola frondosa TaxID=5627 RepID=A0A1C7MQZ4_GRIFR|nr:hypothetical protein A0H81_00558 [Grifola frondosa]
MSELADWRSQSALDPLVAQCITVLWPLAIPKLSPETLLECFGAVVKDYVASASGRQSGWKNLQAHKLIVSSYRTALANTASKKKLYSLFLQTHFLSWLKCTRPRNGKKNPIKSSNPKYMLRELTRSLDLISYARWENKNTMSL